MISPMMLVIAAFSLAGALTGGSRTSVEWPEAWEEREEREDTLFRLEDDSSTVKVPEAAELEGAPRSTAELESWFALEPGGAPSTLIVTDEATAG
jgi:hypothetical protein